MSRNNIGVVNDLYEKNRDLISSFFEEYGEEDDPREPISLDIKENDSGGKNHDYLTMSSISEVSAKNVITIEEEMTAKSEPVLESSSADMKIPEKKKKLFAPTGSLKNFLKQDSEDNEANKFNDPAPDEIFSAIFSESPLVFPGEVESFKENESKSGSSTKIFLIFLELFPFIFLTMILIVESLISFLVPDEGWLLIVEVSLLIIELGLSPLFFLCIVIARVLMSWFLYPVFAGTWFFRNSLGYIFWRISMVQQAHNVVICIVFSLTKLIIVLTTDLSSSIGTKFIIPVIAIAEVFLILLVFISFRLLLAKYFYDLFSSFRKDVFDLLSSGPKYKKNILLLFLTGLGCVCFLFSFPLLVFCLYLNFLILLQKHDQKGCQMCYYKEEIDEDPAINSEDF